MLKYAKQLASESLVYGVSGVVSRLLFVFLVPVYTRVFVPREYGELGLVLTAMAAVAIFVTLALDNSTHRWFWDSDETADRKATVASWAWCQAAVALLFAGGITLAAPWLARALIGRAGAAPLLVLGAWALPLTAWQTVATNWLRLQRRPWATVGYTLGTTAASIGLTIALVVYLHRGVGGVLEAQLAAAGVAAVAALLLMGDWLHPRWFRPRRLREMLRYALPLIPAAVAFWAVAMLDRWFVQRYASTAQVGLYQVGAAVAGVVAVGTTAFQQAWGPFSLSIHRQPDARRFYGAALVLYLWVACLAATAVSLFAPEALRVFATPAYAGSATVVAFLSFGYVMMGMSYVASLGAGLAKRTAPMGAAAIAAAAANVALNLVLVPRWGKEGAALATLVSQAVVPLYLFRASQRVYPIPYRFGAAAAVVGFSGVAVAAGAFWHPPSVAVAVAGKTALLLLFVPLLLALRVVPLGRVMQILRARGAAPGPVPGLAPVGQEPVLPAPAPAPAPTPTPSDAGV